MPPVVGVTLPCKTPDLVISLAEREKEPRIAHSAITESVILLRRLPDVINRQSSIGGK